MFSPLTVLSSCLLVNNNHCTDNFVMPAVCGTFSNCPTSFIGVSKSTAQRTLESGVVTTTSSRYSNGNAYQSIFTNIEPLLTPQISTSSLLGSTNSVSKHIMLITSTLSDTRPSMEYIPTSSWRDPHLTSSNEVISVTLSSGLNLNKSVLTGPVATYLPTITSSSERSVSDESLISEPQFLFSISDESLISEPQFLF